jgi:hypothetical protein
MPDSSFPSFDLSSFQGFKYFKRLFPLLDRLHSVGTKRDPAKNRLLFFDQYASLLLFYFFNPTITSLRSLQRASALPLLQKKLGIRKTSLGSLSEASSVFDPELLREILAELASEVPPSNSVPERNALFGLTAIDGSLLKAIPKMTWALWMDEKNKAAKMHLAFEVLRGIPIAVSLTRGSAPERTEFRALLQPGRLYVFDRGYAEYKLFQEIIDNKSSFIGRLYKNAVFTVIEERNISQEAKDAGVKRDVLVKLGGLQPDNLLKELVRIVIVETKRKSKTQENEEMLLVTDKKDIDAELVASGYKHRWSIELFFRWFKCTLGCRHLLSNSQNGMEIQVYIALIASLVIQIWTGKKPTKATYEILCLYLSGWATEKDVMAHLDSGREAPP